MKLSDWIIVALVLAAGVLLITYGAKKSPAAEPTVTLVWTAPADTSEANDRAVGYEMRFSTSSPTGTDSTSVWNWYQSATPYVGSLPQPGVPGTVDSVVVSGLIWNRTYWFAIRSFDDGLPQFDGTPRVNYSGVSNVASKNTGLPPDNIPPRRITDLLAR